MKAIKNRDMIAQSMPTEAIQSVLAASKRVLVVSHIDPDGDALGTQLAVGEYLEALGKQVFMVRDSEIPAKYAFLPRIDQVRLASSLPAGFTADTAVVLECPTIERIGSAATHLTGQVRIVNIDHHRDNGAFGEINWVDIEPSSVGEMVFEYFEAVGFGITKTMAECIYTAMLTDTGRFRYGSTSPRTMEIAGTLIEMGADPHKITDRVYYNLRPSTMKLTGKVLNSVEFYCEGRVCILSLTQEMLKQAHAVESESDGLVDFTLFTQGVRAGALVKELKDGTTKVSFRSQDGINVSALAYKYGGGGHFNAAGCVIPKPFPEAKLEVMRMLCEADHALA
ncbi:MAG: bifunctional oligoribonuclease/PAP phosphatase NrnA [candidate division Zixibacteria bacterium]|nr:bifunctional oligoribonuclease/PAP phosphatase NrnA [candidate division Zixibacteria bacterium]